jgi:methylmalonyl-CoA mutase
MMEKPDPGHGRQGLEAIIEEVRGPGRHDVKAVDSGWAKLKIEASAAEKQARIDSVART